MESLWELERKPQGVPWLCLCKKGGDHPSMTPGTAFGAHGTAGTRVERTTPKFKEAPANLFFPSSLEPAKGNKMSVLRPVSHSFLDYAMNFWGDLIQLVSVAISSRHNLLIQ